MSGERPGTPVHLAADEPLPLQVRAGHRVALTVRVSCSDQRDRAGLAISVSGPDGQTLNHALAADPNGGGALAVMTLTPPPHVGEHVFRITLPAHEMLGVSYAEAALDVPVRVVPQPTSLAVWDVPLSVVRGAAFTVKAGAKSAANASLAGCPIELVDETGAVAGLGRLGDKPLGGTDALYWTEVSLTAPRREGLATFTARFAAAGLALPHDASGTSFGVAVVPPPEHLLRVKVVEQASCAPIPDVELRLGTYRGTTGEAGLAQIALPKGCYELHLWKVGFEASARTIEIDGDALVQIEATVVPEEDPDARWRM
jgi:hypothetical protein